MSFRIPNRNRVFAHPDVTDGAGEMLTQQSDKDSCDIHLIVRKAEKTGVFEAPIFPQRFGNGIVPDFRAAQDMIAIATQTFEYLPSKLREKFGNDPGSFVEFCSDPDNRAQMVKLGIDTGHLPPEANAGADPAPVEPKGAPPAGASPAA